MHTFSFTSALAALMLIAQGPAAVADDMAAKDWTLVWSDEFDGAQIDPSKWGFDVDCWGGGNDELQCYTGRKENAQIEDGVLRIIARKEAAAGPAYPASQLLGASEEKRKELKAQPFTSARLTTRGKADWTYGRFEARARMPQGQGTWPAIWMLPTEEKYGAWAASGEIDIVEAANLGAKCKKCRDKKKDYIFGTIHYGGVWPKNKYNGKEHTLPPSSDGYHTYAVEWTEGEIKWFVDDVLYHKLKSKKWRGGGVFSKLPKHAPFDQPFHLILNFAVGGHLAVDNDEKGVDVSGYPKSLDIDWVRVYQRQPSPDPAR